MKRVLILILVLVCAGGWWESGWARNADAPASPWGTGSDGNLTVSGTYNLQTQNHPGRVCGDGGDAVAYRVVALATGFATVAVPPQSGCLAPGDEVLLLKLQGAANVGNHEFLRVANVSGNTISFTTPKTLYYGNTSSSDDGLSGSSENVILQRVPHYATLNIQGTLTASPWNGETGGVVVFRALQVQGSGSIQVDGLGFRGGAGGSEGSCAYQGESLPGAGTGCDRNANLGGGGAGLNTGFHVFGGGGGGNYGGGAMAGTGDSSNRGLAGQAYGSPDLQGWFLGSGGGGGSGQWYGGGPGGRGGGVVFAAAEDWSGFAGTIDASGTDGSSNGGACGGGGAGGTIYLKGDVVHFGSALAVGGSGDCGNSTTGGAGGVGRIRIDYLTSWGYSGTVAPVPYVYQLPTPTPTPTPTFTPTPTPTNTPTPTSTPTFTPTPTSTNTPTSTSTPVSTNTPGPPGPSPTGTPTPAPTVNNTPGPTGTATPGSTPTPTSIYGDHGDSNTSNGDGNAAGQGESASPSDAGKAEISEPMVSLAGPLANSVIAIPYGPVRCPVPALVVQVYTDQNRDGLISRNEGVDFVRVTVMDVYFSVLAERFTYQGLAVFCIPDGWKDKTLYVEVAHLYRSAQVQIPKKVNKDVVMQFQASYPLLPVALPGVKP